jgi:hypothetical protein
MALWKTAYEKMLEAEKVLDIILSAGQTTASTSRSRSGRRPTW